jgi:uncharacterized membrane protein YfcA
VDAGPVRDVLTVGAGVATGVLSGAFGVGGATISTPAIRGLGASALLAVGTTLPSIFPSAISGTARYVREDLIDWRIVMWAAPAGVLAAVAGSLLSNVIPGNGHWLMIATALLLGFTAWRTGRSSRAEPKAIAPEADIEAAPDSALEESQAHTVATRVDAQPVTVVGVGILAGLMSGLLGIGGGVVMVPGFTELVKLPLKQAIATSLACVAIFAVPGTITHWALGDIDWRFAILLAIGVIPGARLGAVLAIRASNKRLHLAVASFLGFTAAIYLIGEIRALTA